jgi:hypothetical protein
MNEYIWITVFDIAIDLDETSQVTGYRQQFGAE